MEKAHNVNVAYMGLEMERTMTCNRPMCDKCATEIAHEIDYCTKCINRIKMARRGR